MKTFELSTHIIEKLVQILGKAEKFINIAMFQIHNEDIFNVLVDRLHQGVFVHIITLPYDSINENIREKVENHYKTLESLGAKISFCKWNIGDPSRTTTAVGRWYSFHGKFIIIDDIAIGLSANFTESEELDACLIYENDPTITKLFQSKFQDLIALFVEDKPGNTRYIPNMIIDKVGSNQNLFLNLPKNIPIAHLNYWILDYPSSLCPNDAALQENIYLCPFDIRGRSLYMKLIDEAENFVYISTESFTDIDFSEFLIKSKLRNLDISILSGTKSMDFTDRMQVMLRNLIANHIKIHTIDGNIHAKLLLTDKRVAISSINLNKMNLGFARTSHYWRENTETVVVCDDKTIIEDAKSQYLNIFNSSIDVTNILTSKLEVQVSNILSTTFGFKTKREAKVFLARFILAKELEVKQLVYKIGYYASQLVKRSGTLLINKEDIQMAIILHFLSEKKLDESQLKEKLVHIDPQVNLTALLFKLQSYSFIEFVGSFYKLRVDTLIK